MTRKMKNSGVKWIGEIPKDWEVVKNKYLFRSKKIVVGKRFKEYNLLSLTKRKGIIYRDIDAKEGKLPESFSTYQSVKKDDLVLCLFDLDISSVFSDVSKLEGMISSAYNVFSIKNDYPMFYKYWFDMINDGRKYRIYSKSLRSTIDIDNFGSLFSVMPSLPQQKLIVDFLDEKTQEIDKIISKTKKAIEYYKKYKQSFITETVTRGLNKNVQMKDSGIEWIGDIPEHWEVIRLGFLGRLQNGINKAGEEFGFGFPFINYGDIYRNYQLDKSEFSGLVNSTEKERENYSVKKGDVLFTRTSEIKEEIGYAATCLESIENAVFTGFAIRFRPFKKSRLYPGFSKYYFRSEIHRKYFVKEMNIVTRVSLGQELLMKLSVLLPPLDEQEKISTYLDEKCEEIDNVISKKEKLLEEMEAYKKSLIYETVTGKREVQ